MRLLVDDIRLLVNDMRLFVNDICLLLKDIPLLFKDMPHLFNDMRLFVNDMRLLLKDKRLYKQGKRSFKFDLRQCRQGNSLAASFLAGSHLIWNFLRKLAGLCNFQGCGYKNAVLVALIGFYIITGIVNCSGEGFVEIFPNQARECCPVAVTENVFIPDGLSTVNYGAQFD
jgi:hypothetical protein